MSVSVRGRHKLLQREVQRILEAVGFLCAEATYHSVMPAQVQRRLVDVYDATSLYIRTRADRIAIHKELPIVLEWEAKAHIHPFLNDMTLELLPVLHHLKQAELGVKCLYAYRDDFINVNAGFWSSDFPEVREVYLTGRYPKPLREKVEAQVTKYMPEAKVFRKSSSVGSNDPFLIIDESVVRDMDDWRLLILGELAEGFVRRC